MRPCALLILLCALVPRALAAPVVTVKAYANLRIVGVYRGPTGLTLVGELQDRDFLVGLPSRSVEVTIREGGAALTRTVTTDDQGRFSIPVRGDSTTYTIAARFSGDREYAAEAPTPQVVDVTKQSLDIEVATAAELDASRPQQPIKVTTRAAGHAVSARISIRTDRGRDLGQIVTDTQGRATATLQTASLGPPGALALIFTFAGDRQLNATTTRVEMMLLTPVQLTLAADPRVDADGEILLSGQVSDLRGPIRGAAISVEAMGRHAASTLSDSQGRFHLRLAAADHPPGALELVARYTPAVIWRRAAASPLVQVMILAPRPIPLRVYFIPAAVTAAVILALLLIRFWPVLRSRLRRRVRPTAPSLEASRPVRSGVQLSRANLRSLMRPSHDISGEVWDPTDSCPVSGAQIAVRREHELLRTVETDARGRFVIDDLPVGVLQVTVARRGYVQERFVAQLPHRGSLHDLRVAIVQVRVRVLEIYHEAALPLLPDRGLWACWTPRELARHTGAQLGRRPASLVELTLMLERAYWSGDAAEEKILERARQLV
jgi:hypothetical protein